jgi:hypothetical protein
MTGTTPIEGYPYPLESDFADAQDVFRLATAVDADLRGEQAPFRAFMGRPSFIGRSTANGPAGTGGINILTMGAIDWDNTGGLVAGANVWNQPLNQPPSWWLFGCTLLIANSVAGAVGDLVMAQIAISTTDQVTGVVTETDYFQRNDESNTGGEWLNVFAMAPIYQGNVQCVFNWNGSTAKATQSGSRLWGMCMGPVT